MCHRLAPYRPGWFEGAHWRELAGLAGVTRQYLAHEMRAMADGARQAATRLAPLLRATLGSDKQDFLAERVNPVIALRAQWLQAGADGLR